MPVVFPVNQALRDAAAPRATFTVEAPNLDRTAAILSRYSDRLKGGSVVRETGMSYHEQG
jgi:hypothetical protein